ncbi:MAG: hypothetical protein A2017_09050 [Lentisphaerae bacterium GWF2_44_16]|nr:MAG: hypothetical protein A2017_09050 [Lentisphaerae bacterium GWF2_44_16]
MTSNLQIGERGQTPLQSPASRPLHRSTYKSASGVRPPLPGERGQTPLQAPASGRFRDYGYGKYKGIGAYVHEKLTIKEFTIFENGSSTNNRKDIKVYIEKALGE